jgi:Ca2+-binding RTX toxin-like protein
MATLSVDPYYSFDLAEFNLNRLYTGSGYCHGSSLFRVSYGGGDLDDFRGTGFRYNSQGELIGGTIRSYEGFLDGDLAVKITGSVAASALTAAARTYSTGDDFRLYSMLFGGADTISGSLLSDHLQGFGGNDTIRGFSGNDRIEGGWGADTMNGGFGADSMSAGLDDARDVFVFASGGVSGKTSGTWDRIFQFDRHNKSEGVWDRVDLSRIDADNELAGDQKFRFVTDFWKVDPSRAEGQVRVQDLGADVNVHIDLNGDTVTDMIIKVVGVGTLTWADFLL